MKIFLDTETCGLHGLPTLIQYAVEDGEIILFSPWIEPIHKTLELIEFFCDNEVIGFNLAFDWFHLSKLYTTFNMFPDKEACAIDHIGLIARYEYHARNVDLCIKPKSAFDIMLHAKRGPFQSTMDREDIVIKRVPTAIAWILADELEKRVKLDPIYFSRKVDQNAKRWVVKDIKTDFGINPDFKNIVLVFAASASLKNLAKFALKEDVIFHDEISPPLYPEELGYAPFAMAIGTPADWNGSWPSIIKSHINHWAYNTLARKYAAQDIDLTRKLYRFFGCPPIGDTNSLLACMVASVRWRGFSVDISKINLLITKYQGLMKEVPTAPEYVKRWIMPDLSPEEQLAINGSTAKSILEEMNKWKNDDGSQHEAAIKAGAVLDARKIQKKIQILEKLLIAGRFHASFKVTGTLSDRMSGTDGFNAQAIDKSNEVRELFTFAFEDEITSGGDFDAQEVSIAETVFNDSDLRATLLSGKKIHGLFAMELFKCTYEEATNAKAKEADGNYDKAKRCVFLMFYGGQPITMQEKVGIPLDQGEPAFARFLNRYKGIKSHLRNIELKFSALVQGGGIGTKVEWKDPSDYIESLFGFKRYFTLENSVMRTLFDLAQKPPRHWRDIKIKVFRRNREQTAAGATMSALYAGAFNIQSQNVRAAGNHVIQSSGAHVTKAVQKAIWDLQPAGVHAWRVRLINIHDEVVVVHKSNDTDLIKETVNKTISEYRNKVPLLGMTWKSNLSSWASK
jgi:hypothetical protein